MCNKLAKTSFSHSKSSLTQTGKYLATFPTPAIILQMLWTSMIGSRKVINATSPDSKEDLVFFKDLIAFYNSVSNGGCEKTDGF